MNSNNFFFYDLETTGINARSSRIMQFAGQRTDMSLKPIGEPYNFLIKLSDDVLPDPDAILITGITPQQTLQDGITEAEFTKLFAKEIVQPGTCFVGYNSIRFDDEFMRFLLYRNFYDPYAWQWKNDCSRWDLLDVVRLTRALRPESINWPFDEKGVATNRLELITKENNLLHEAAHDALSDVKATIAVANMIKAKQPKLFDYLFTLRQKKEVSKLVLSGKPFVYASGRYPNEFLKTTVAINLGMHPTTQNALVYDLRHDPTPFLAMSVDELVEVWRYTKDKDAIRLPVKGLQFNRAPAVAPLGVLDDASKDRLQIDMNTIEKNRSILKTGTGFYERVSQAAEQMNIERDKRSALQFKAQVAARNPDALLYDKFIPDVDRPVAESLQKAKPDALAEYANEFKDERLKNLVPLYKARNYPGNLTDEERSAWESYREHALLEGGTGSRLAQFGARLQELSQSVTDEHKLYLLEELRLYGESIMPELTD
ncbi:MAG: exodeoxyribonuclease I [Candidatus Saccharimonadales bacterium]